MSLWIYDNDGTPDSAATAMRLTCIDHPQYEGTRQTRAYLDYCPGCRAVYHVYKAMRHIEPGRDVPDLRIELVR